MWLWSRSLGAALGHFTDQSQASLTGQISKWRKNVMEDVEEPEDEEAQLFVGQHKDASGVFRTEHERLQTVCQYLEEKIKACEAEIQHHSTDYLKELGEKEKKKEILIKNCQDLQKKVDAAKAKIKQQTSCHQNEVEENLKHERLQTVCQYLEEKIKACEAEIQHHSTDYLKELGEKEKKKETLIKNCQDLQKKVDAVKAKIKQQTLCHQNELEENLKNSLLRTSTQRRPHTQNFVSMMGIMKPQDKGNRRTIYCEACKDPGPVTEEEEVPSWPHLIPMPFNPGSLETCCYGR